MRPSLLALVFLFLGTAGARAAIKTETIEYKHGDTTCEGFLAYDDSSKEKRPGVLVSHDWTGLNDHAKQSARRLAELGYVAFALDMYGKGVRAKSPADGPKLSAPYKADRKLMRARAAAALDVLKKQPLTDPSRVAAIGYCFGGQCVLELARGGADLVGVVSFHGALDTPTPEDAKNIKGKVLALHGADDPFVPAKDVAAFEEEMRKGGVDWQLVMYGGAVHSFTNPSAGNDNGRGAAYNEKADRRSWRAMRNFFGEVFNK
jgi:dienelactone hydrolase